MTLTEKYNNMPQNQKMTAYLVSIEAQITALGASKERAIKAHQQFIEETNNHIKLCEEILERNNA